MVRVSLLCWALGWEEALVALSRVSVGKSGCVVVILHITIALSLPV